MDRLRRYLQWLFWHLKSERQQLNGELQLLGKPFTSPAAVRSPTILADTRCELEKLTEIELEGYRPGLSENIRELVGRAFRDLVETRLFTIQFPMAELHGCTSSKARARPERASSWPLQDFHEADQ